MQDPIALLADDKEMITYRPKLNQLTGSVVATILLQQIIYRWVRSNRHPFYKFGAPCAHPNYKPGDSWQEEIGISRSELETALKKSARRSSATAAKPRR
jgi:hypothetical protein